MGGNVCGCHYVWPEPEEPHYSTEHVQEGLFGFAACVCQVASGMQRECVFVGGGC